jgi:Tfp pilus assembly protein PilN
MARLHSCNVLQVGAQISHFWTFSANNGRVELTGEQAGPPPMSLPAAAVAKDWRSIWQKRLNLAWLPAQQIFLRVIHLPTADPGEVRPMVELQLEKLSPLPVAQIVWSFELLPQESTLADPLQTVIVIIAGRALVERFLGELESQGYLADRLEMPLLHELLSTEIDQDGVWIYPSREDAKNFCLVAWWYGGTLQNLNLLHLLSAENWPDSINEELTKMSWAGEVEGWLTSPPRLHLVGDTETARVWEPILRRSSEESVEVINSLPAPELAALNVKRVAGAESNANLLPIEYAARYHQKFIDRLWMRGLLAVILCYAAGVAIYFAALGIQTVKSNGLDKKVKGLTGSYTNALQLKARLEVLQEQSNLKYAALDSWRAITEPLPEGMTLTSMSFQRGRKLGLTGLATDESKVPDYQEALNNATANEKPLFNKVTPKLLQQRTTPQGAQWIWNIECELQRQEVP